MKTEEISKILAEHLLWLRGNGGSRADLTGANLRDADLTGANLTGANLTGANLTGANLTPIKNDLIANILRMPNEIPFLRQALVAGDIDGSTYSGDCACLAGTMAHACGVRSIEQFQGMDLMPVDAGSPRERWFLAINPGCNPDNHAVAKLTLEWIDEALAMVCRIRSQPIPSAIVPIVMLPVDGLRAD